MKGVLNIAEESHEPIKVNKNPLAQKTSDSFLTASDTEIWSALKSGNHEALSFIYNKYIHHLFRFGYQLSKDKDLIKDCIQEIFISIAKTNDIGKKVSSIKSYLFKALYREIVYRHSQNRKTQLIDPIENHLAFTIDISVESRMINHESLKEKIAQIKKELNKLPEKQRQLILHYYYDGLTYDEIAEIMGFKHRGTVSKLIKRVLNILRKNVGACCFPFLSGFF